jgi:hypothetical protein
MTYVASVTKELRIWLISAFSALALALVGFVVFMGMFTGEYLCEDRDPWWGPPEDPNSECSGLWYAEKHPGEYPWTMPR